MALTATGTIAAQNTATAPWVSRGGSMIIQVAGGGGSNFGGGTVTLQCSLDGATWVSAVLPNTAGTAAMAATANATRHLTDLPAGLQFRLSIGAATTPDVDYFVMQARDI
jgi:hypothetical protein